MASSPRVALADPMKIYVFPADKTGCGYYRLIWPAEILQQRGHDIRIIMPHERDHMLQGEMRGDKMIKVKIPSDADVIVFQRVTHRHLVQAMKLIRQHGVATVVDMDDDLTCIHPSNPAFHALHPKSGYSDHSWENTLRACDVATLVTVSTPALIQRYARRNNNGHVLYNMIPERMLDVERVDSDVVGWGGAVFSHPLDLQELGPSIAQVIQGGGRFKIAGPINGIHQALGIGKTTEIDSTGSVPMNDWPQALSTLGIGVAPLADTKFNAAKSWLKMAEYAAVGVPCVASPRAEYTRLHRRGVGWLAKNPNEWRKKLNILRTSADARQELSLAGREAMHALTLEFNAQLWWDAWTMAYELQNSGQPRQTTGEADLRIAV